MVADRLPEWGVTRSFTALAVDVADAVVFVVGHFLAVLLSSAVWLALGAVFAAVAPVPGGVGPETLATVVWLAIVVTGPAVVVARVLRAPIRMRLTDRPVVVLVPPVLLLGAVFAVVVETAATPLAVLALVVATFVLVRRVVHLYAQHVRVGPLTRTARFRVATAALLPLSFVLLFLNAAALDGVVPLGDTGWAWLRDALATLGVPVLVDVGEATFDAHVLALLAAPVVLCGMYVVSQLLSAVAVTLAADAEGTSPLPVVDRVASGTVALPGSGSVATWLWTAVGGTAPTATSSAASITLPDSKADWKYDDADAERAHRQAQQRDPAEAVEIGEVVPLVLEEADYSSDPPTIMGSRNALKVFVEDVPRGLSERDTICVKVTDYGGKRTSAEAVFLSRGRCSKADRRA
ncbi:hypothetical protein SAMN05216559_0011 [Halomicrobium zhouii]|uniref:Uncharacterized protein n=1 Tax=Halomicrobium zhouii TaxID=767519 RepID=A0A1I6K1J7_9EURY|nr:hypothetical protein [Halomicrobium zhouii]SFR84978.1 hypothetical protein SAMN05216559_0011 [Halomicrobium zhouii]